MADQIADDVMTRTRAEVLQSLAVGLGVTAQAMRSLSVVTLRLAEQLDAAVEALTPQESAPVAPPVTPSPEQPTLPFDAYDL